ncbi:biotin--[acetyl-CoA-carboxylase] ligase [bacterium]|nr:biotin--[acetyl-CoA-carboxylase] ligase [bacterium]
MKEDISHMQKDYNHSEGFIRDYSLYSYKEISSTNTVAKELSESGSAKGIVTALTQSGGRGRRERVWDSPEGGLWFSLFETVPDEDIRKLSFFMNFGIILAAINTMKQYLDSDTLKVKWPNDIYASGKKLGGVLLETFDGPSGKTVVSGMGLNTWNGSKENWTSLLDLGIKKVPNFEILEKLIMNLNILREKLYDSSEELMAGWEKYDLFSGKTVKVKSSQGNFEGTVKGYSSSGALIISASSGGIRTIETGEVENVR